MDCRNLKNRGAADGLKGEERRFVPLSQIAPEATPRLKPNGDFGEHVIPFFAFPPAVRIIYTTNAIESLNRVIRKPPKPVAAFQPMPPPPS